MELQFDNRGRTIGVKNLDYLLEKTRVTSVPRNESNFHVFYQMLAGVTTEEKAHFQLHEPGHFHYLQSTLPAYSPDQLNNQFHDLKTNMKGVGFNRKFQSQIFQVLAAILHLGNIQFANQHGAAQEAAYVKNDEVLNTVADFLGLLPSSLEGLLTYKTKLIKKEMCTVYLDAAQSAAQRDDLATVLYSLLFSWIIEYINTRLCKENQANFIGLLDLPGFQVNPNGNGFEQFLTNYANERLYNYMCYQLFEASNDAYAEDMVQIPIVPYVSNQPVTTLLGKSGTGVISILHKQANKARGPNNDPGMLAALHKAHAENDYFSANLNMGEFTIRHFAAPVTYSSSGFMAKNMDSICLDFVSTFKGDSGIPVGNPFVSGLFTSSAVTTESHPKNTAAIVSAQQNAMPARKPSMKNPRSNKDTEEIETSTGRNRITCASTQFQTALDELFDTFDNTEPWFVICLRANNSNVSDQFDSGTIGDQVDRYSLANLAQRKEIEYTVCYQHDEFVGRYLQILEPMGIDPNRTAAQICEAAANIFGWGPEHIALGHQFCYLSDEVWRDLEDHLRATERENMHRGFEDGGLGAPKPGFMNDDAQSFYSDDDNIGDDQQSVMDADPALASQEDILLTRAENNLKVIEEEEEEEEDDKPPKTRARKAWVCCTWSLTWWIPSFLLSCCGRMKNRDIRMAWREKVALCLIIFLMCASMILFICGINYLVCPKRNIMAPSEVTDAYNLDKANKAYTYVYGRVYNINKLNSPHGSVATTQIAKIFAGKDASGLFPMQLSSLCLRYDGTNIDERLNLQNDTTGQIGDMAYAKYHDHRFYMGNAYNPTWFQSVMNVMDSQYKVSDLAFDVKAVASFANQDKTWVIYNNQVYDFTDYIKQNFFTLPSSDGQLSQDTKSFLDPTFVELVTAGNGKDITQQFDKLYSSNGALKTITLGCMNQIFYRGKVDDRNSFRCMFSSYVLLALSVFIFLILFAKFLASLSFGSKPEPEDHDKFVICNVPCYTEGEDSLRKTIDSLAVLKYDDKRKLLFIICDGMIVGGGNDAPTPRIVLDILGSDPNLQPEPLSFLSLGEGMKQHNMGKVYTGLYECQGHVVPYMVVVKTGRPIERSRPGNRGKRDSQLILMRFFNKVHYDYPMTPLELEIYHQIKNVIGVDPHFYEYVLMVDADTLVMPDSLNRLISAMLHDMKIMGICGETALENEKDTWATMIQVYEYFISHHLAKAFESLFGTVTCLPGCFCMYRIRAPNKNVPLLVNNAIIKDYSENVVDTLHKKNLLHLGEDRYLTTLMLKHFPFFKMTFTSDAKCLTMAPDTWGVLLSQRRRWINSTVHNLLELVFLPRLCGFCCFSMRFVVFMDLLSTIVMPASIFVLGYLFYVIATSTTTLPTISICLIVAPYVLQVLVFIIRRKWEHIGWMIVYILALPVFAFFIPVYSFWHFDDFSWGNTRLVVGEGGKKKKVVAADEGKFDPKSIPVKKWSEYEEEIWENGTEYSADSKQSGYTSKTSESVLKKGLHHQQGSFLTPAPGYPGANPSYDMSQFYPPSSPVPHGPGSRPGSRLNLNASSADMRGGSNLDLSYGAHAIPMNNMNTMNSAISLNRPVSHVAPSYYDSPSRAGSPSMLLANQQPAPQSYPMAQNMSGYLGPSDQEIAAEVKRILSSANLMNITKKQMREDLSRIFNCDMTPRKDYINYCIEMVLQGQM
jgi:chitin synthase